MRRSPGMRTAALALTLLLAASTLAVLLPGNTVIAQENEWPWGAAEEPFPWLEYLKSLPHDTNITLVVLTRHEATIWQKTQEVFLESEVAKQLGIDNIIFVQAPPELWSDFINQSIQKGRPVDVAWGGGPTLFDMLDSKGMLESLNPQAQPAYYAVLYELSKLPERAGGAPTYKVGDDGYVHWIGAAISSFGFTVNNSVLEKYGLPKPETWADLGWPEFAKLLPNKPFVGIADPRKSTSNTRMYEIILQGYGWEEGWRVLTLMAANSQIFDSSSGVRDAVIRGDIAVGITIDFYGYTAMHQSPYCEFILPEGLSIVNADPIAIIKSTTHPVQAAAFVAWVLSEYGGQQIWLDPDINRLPINPAVFNTSAGQARPDLKQAFEVATQSESINFSDKLAVETEQAMKMYFAATLINAHDDLQSVWSLIAKAYLNGSISKSQFDELVKMLTDPFEFRDPLTGQNVTFTLEYARTINPYLGNASIFQTLMQEWEEGARNKYLATYDRYLEILEYNKEHGVPQEESPTATNQTEGGQAPEQPAPPAEEQGGGLSAGQLAVIIVGVIILVAAAYFLFIKK